LALLERAQSELTLTTQTELLSLNRTSLYYRPVLPTPKEVALKHRIDALYTERPFYGVRRITAQLRRDGRPDVFGSPFRFSRLAPGWWQGYPSSVKLGVMLWLTSLRNAIFHRSSGNESLAQIPHKKAILAWRLPKVTEAGLQCHSDRREESHRASNVTRWLSSEMFHGACPEHIEGFNMTMIGRRPA
jgi:hypothetical protein